MRANAGVVQLALIVAIAGLALSGQGGWAIFFAVILVLSLLE